MVFFPTFYKKNFHPSKIKWDLTKLRLRIELLDTQVFSGLIFRGSDRDGDFLDSKCHSKGRISSPTNPLSTTFLWPFWRAHNFLGVHSNILNKQPSKCRSKGPTPRNYNSMHQSLQPHCLLAQLGGHGCNSF